MIPDIKDCTLEQRQQYYYNAHFCMYCKSETEYVNSLAVYREDYGMVHLCTNKSCGAYVGCMPSSDQALGTTALKPLRNLRIEAHAVYDPIIESKARNANIKRKQAQILGRKWLAEVLGIDTVACHIAYFDEQTCRKVIEICKPLLLTKEQVEAKKKELEEKLQLVRDYSKEFLFELKEFPIMGTIQMELKHQNGKVLYLKIKSKEARWSNKKKPFKFEDVESLIIENFKP